MSKSRKTYHTENTKLERTEKREIEKLSTKLEKQNNWVFIEAQEEEVALERRRQMHLNVSLRNQ